MPIDMISGRRRFERGTSTMSRERGVVEEEERQRKLQVITFYLTV